MPKRTSEEMLMDLPTLALVVTAPTAPTWSMDRVGRAIRDEYEDLLRIHGRERARRNMYEYKKYHPDKRTEGVNESHCRAWVEYDSYLNSKEKEKEYPDQEYKDKMRDLAQKMRASEAAFDAAEEKYKKYKRERKESEERERRATEERRALLDLAQKEKRREARKRAKLRAAEKQTQLSAPLTVVAPPADLPAAEPPAESPAEPPPAPLPELL